MIANTQKQALHEHLYAVAILSKYISSFKTSNVDIQQCCLMAGLFHDIGKIDAPFQAWASKGKTVFFDNNGEHIETGKFSFEKHARHNELSTWTFAVLAGAERSSKKEFLKHAGFANHDIRFIDIIKHAVYWHHAKPLRKQDFQDLGTIQKKSIPDVSDWLNKTSTLIEKVAAFSSALPVSAIRVASDDIDEIVEDISKEPLPAYKRYRLDHEGAEDYSSDIQYNACCNIVRSSLICADKIISSLTAAELSDAIANHRIEALFSLEIEDHTLSHAINQHASMFYPGSERTKRQQSVANALSRKEGVAALCGPAGCGKTKIALEWARARGARKLYWVVPRVSVALGLYHEISSDDYLPDCNVEIFTSEYKLTRHQGIEHVTPEKEYLSGHVIITTIDQLVNAISTHRNINIFTDFMLHHAVFDEFHEFINMDALNLLFAEIVDSKRYQQGQANMLLVSATPHYTFCQLLLEIEPNDFVEMASSNASSYTVEFEDFTDQTDREEHPLYREVPENSIVINNTATRAQLSYLHRCHSESSVLFHSKLAAEDRRQLFKRVFNAFKQKGDRSISILRSAPIVQASLNITCQYMVTEATTPENMLQRLGRLDRFSEFESANRFIVAVPESVRRGKIIDNEARFLNSLNIFYTTVAWVEYLTNQSLAQVFVSDLYDLYKAFHRTERYRKVMLSDLSNALKQSAQSIEKKVVDPLWIKPKAEKKTLLKKMSLRGDSRYVQMIRAEFNKGALRFTNVLAFSVGNAMTLSLSEIDNGDESPLNFMSRKHHQITGEGSRYENHSARLKDAARSIENPIYTSYPPEALAKINEVNAASSLVYVSTPEQVVGCMRLSALNPFI